jgi:hypothetical protein
VPLGKSVQISGFARFDGKRLLGKTQILRGRDLEAAGRRRVDTSSARVQAIQRSTATTSWARIDGTVASSHSPD